MKVETLLCPKCGEPLRAAQRFCSSCGAPVSSDNEAQSKRELQMKRPENGKHESGKSKALSFVFLVVALTFTVLYLGLLGYSLRGAITTKANSVTVATSANEYQGLPYQLVKSDMNDMGFTNIEMIPLEDLTLDQAADDGAVESISIKGNSNFEEDATFSKDDAVIITYHTLPSHE